MGPGLHSGRDTRKMTTEFHKHGLTTDGLEGIGKVQQESLAIIVMKGCHQVICDMNNSFSPSLDTHSQLQRREQPESLLMRKGDKALQHQPPQNLSNREGTVTSLLFLTGQECSTTIVRGDNRWSSVRSQTID